jgi:uroporphyrinogen decarboxylase
MSPWYWPKTLERWRQEGLPREADPAQYFETDTEVYAPVYLQGQYGPHLLPPLERLVLEETEIYQIVRDEERNTVRVFKQHELESMPAWVAYPIVDRASWETLVKPRLDARVPGRAPQGQDLEAHADQVRERDYPLGLWAGSFYGWPRSLMGVEAISVLFYDDPALMHEICEHIENFIVETITPILEAVQFDFAFLWEDMAGKAGPLCSPATYREFFLPSVQRVTSLLRKRGIEMILVDSDGNNDVLIPLWLEVGVSGLSPFEIAAGCDPVRTRREYPGLIMQGGIDKRAVARGPEAIDREVLSKVPWLCLQGGYFPKVDHLVPPDVSLANYKYYSRLMRQVVEDPERWLHEARRRGFWED